MSDVFDDEDAAFVLRLYESNPDHTTMAYLYRGRGSGNCYYSTMSDCDCFDITIEHISRFELMGVLDETPKNLDEWYVRLNRDHPDVKMIIDAMELL